jgi:ATPase subunit of ABC transporter with duplicated ATPase domains
MLVKASHLSKTVGAKTLFTDLNFHIDLHEKVALIGRNGQGKSTLLQIIAGVDHDFGGEIETKKISRLFLRDKNTL